MARRTSERTILLLREVQKHIASARNLLASDAATEAAAEAREALRLARSSRAHWPISEAWLTLVDVLGELHPSDSEEYREVTRGAFYWAETMPEEIQVWLFDGLLPHLESLGLDNLQERAEIRIRRARTWLDRGNLNVATRIARFHIADVEAGRAIDARALSIERMAAMYADELWDSDGQLLQQAAAIWVSAGRPDRATFLSSLADEVNRRGK